MVAFYGAGKFTSSTQCSGNIGYTCDYITTFTNNWTTTKIPTPAGDTCTSAVILTNNTPYTVQTLGALDDTTPVRGQIYKGIWFSFVPSVTGTATVETCASDYQTAIEIMIGSCGSLTSIANNSGSGPSCQSLQASVSFPCVAGTSYLICAGGYSTRYYGTLVIQAQASSSSNPGNLAPTNILLDGSLVEENQAAGTIIGAFETQDPNANDTFTYTLASGIGGEDNGAFSIDESNLLTASIFNYEVKSNYSIRVQSIDQGGLSTQAVFTINISDIDEPAPSFAETPTMSNGNMVIRWGSITNKQYTVHYSTNLLSGFTPLQSNIPGTPAINSYTDSLTTGTQKYWKVTTDE
jgi:hypothetical protein